MQEMFSWLSYIVKGRYHYVVTVHAEAHTNAPVFTCGFAQENIWVLSYIIPGAITAKEESFLHQMR